jgi:hypothetical protein
VEVKDRRVVFIKLWKQVLSYDFILCLKEEGMMKKLHAMWNRKGERDILKRERL